LLTAYPPILFTHVDAKIAKIDH